MTTVEDTVTTDWAAWHAQREEALRAPHGWLSVTALHWLTPEPSAYPPIPGRWSTGPDGVRLTADEADGLRGEGVLLTGEILLQPAEGAAGVPVTYDDKLIEVIRRTGHHALRLRDPQAPTRTGFTGVPAYPADRRWIVPARFEPYDTPRAVIGGAVVDRLEHHHVVRGVLRFAVQDREHTLLAFDGGPGRLSVLFRDATSGVTTHGGVRSLTVEAGDEAGPVTIDFNRAVNLPCAFTEHATCPLPLPENVLTLAVEAGEQRPAAV